MIMIILTSLYPQKLILHATLIIWKNQLFKIRNKWKKEGLLEDWNTLVSDKEKSSKTIETESFNTKTIFLKKNIYLEEKEKKKKIMIILMMNMINLLMVMKEKI